MIRLNFTANREPISITIEDKRIMYHDRKWPQGFLFMPKDQKVIAFLLANQRKFPAAVKIIEWIQSANSGKNLEEYNNAKSDEELEAIVRRDALANGLVEIK